LSQEDTEHFVKAVAGVQPSSGLVESIYTHTEGNPFFMAELISRWREIKLSLRLQG
jgi:predicted ATPase